MNKKIVQSTLLALAMAGGSVCATELHAPLPGGPLRYDFEYLKKDKQALNIWSTGYMREADKAYAKHGFKTKPLSNLIFGKSEFTISEAFQDAKDDQGYFENNHPGLSTVKIAPRVSFEERGIVLGADWSMPVMKNKGRIGIRASLPLRDVRMEKDNEAEAAVTGDQSKVLNEVRFISMGTKHAGGSVNDYVLNNVTSYNLKYLANIKTLDGTGKVVGLFKPGNPAALGGVPTTTATANIGGLGSNTHFVPMLVIKSTASGQPPRGQGGGVLLKNVVSNDESKDLVDARGGNTRIGYAAPDGKYYAHAMQAASPGATTNDSKFGGMDGVTAFTQVPADFAGAGVGAAMMLESTVDYDVTKIDSDLWATTIHGANGAPVAESNSAKSFIDNALLYHKTSVGQFLKDRGYVFETYNLAGLGDANVDLFYSHKLTKKVIAELALGVVIPTGAGDKYFGNPYRKFLGNGDHIELKAGAKLAANLFKCFDFKADARYNFVLETTEHRMQVFKNSTIKNIGNPADADVSWGYFTGNVDVTMYHPKTRDIATTIGYQLYYKTEDKVNFKEKTTTNHMLGQVWSHANGTLASATNPGSQWAAFPRELGNKEARRGTESIAHRAYVEGSYTFSKYLTLSVGGKWTFAGQNVAADGEAFTGVNVKF